MEGNGHEVLFPDIENIKRLRRSLLRVFIAFAYNMFRQKLAFLR
jgi:hypothetical protein